MVVHLSVDAAQLVRYDGLHTVGIISIELNSFLPLAVILDELQGIGPESDGVKHRDACK